MSIEANLCADGYELASQSDPQAKNLMILKGQNVGTSERTRPTTGKEALLLALLDTRGGLLQLGIKEEVLQSTMTYAAHCDPSVAARALPWAVELKTAVHQVVAVYSTNSADYWRLAKQLQLNLPQVKELRRLTKAALEAWNNRPLVLRPAR